ncbi:MAG: ABC transporter substrate-binding protein [Roseburia sp.]|nr:ABC transporter substrate-binding protein [Roseburia sp.]
MGKRICFLGCLLLLLAGCGSGQEDSFTDMDSTEESENLIVVGLSQVGSESDWRLANTKSYRETFTEENGYYLLFEDGQQKQENQVKAVRNFILQEVDYIVLDPVVETGWDAVLQEAKDAGIPVILADRTVQVEEEDLYTCWVGSDFFKEGENAGKWLEDYLKKRNKGEEEINIVTLQGTLGSSAQIGRTEGFDRILRKQSNWVMLEQQSGEFVQAKAKEVMEYFLKTYPDIDVVICENDNMAFGAVDAMKEAGKSYGKRGDITVISFDATEAALSAVERGEISVDMECNPLLGPVVDEVIKRLERGQDVEKIQYVEETYFD